MIVTDPTALSFFSGAMGLDLGLHFVLQDRQDLQISSGWETACCIFETIFTDKSKGGSSLCKKVRHASKCLMYSTEE